MRQIVGLVDLVSYIALGTGRTAAFWDLDACAFGEKLHGFDKANAVYFLDKFEDITAAAAAKTVVDLALRINAERRAVFVVKGAKSEKVAPLFVELYVSGDDFGYIGSIADSL